MSAHGLPEKGSMETCSEQEGADHYRCGLAINTGKFRPKYSLQAMTEERDALNKNFSNVEHLSGCRMCSKMCCPCTREVETSSSGHARLPPRPLFPPRVFGCSARVIRDWLGHSSDTTVDNYTGKLRSHHAQEMAKAGYLGLRIGLSQERVALRLHDVVN